MSNLSKLPNLIRIAERGFNQGTGYPPQRNFEYLKINNSQPKEGLSVFFDKAEFNSPMKALLSLQRTFFVKGAFDSLNV